MPLLFLLSCGYHFEGAQKPEKMVSISIPYIKGDRQGLLNSELISALSSSGMFDCVQNGGEWILKAEIIADGDDRIGYRFDRNPTTGKLRDNIVGTENRRTLSAQVTLVDAQTQKVLIGPEDISAMADYDYVDQNSIYDLTFTPKGGHPQKVLDFSLGQLDSVDGAHEDASIVIYRALAQKILDGLIIKSELFHSW